MVLLAACLFALRLAGVPNLLDQDQERPAAYALDAVNNGNWLCQRDLTGDITSKPPLYTWLCALVTLLCGRISIFSLYLPGALGMSGVAWLVYKTGRAHFGLRAALFGALASMLTIAGLKGFGLARTDSVFTFMVTATALLAYTSWIRGRGWTWFWLVAAATVLTKGPLGVMLAAGGLLACLWERKGGQTLPLKGSHVPGITLFLLITVGWLVLAYWQYGQPVIDKLIGKELVGHVVRHRGGNIPGTLFWQPPLYYLGRAAPWSLFAYYGLWRLFKHPATDASERRFERFLFCWFAAGLLVFSMAPHQRADLLWPIMPAGALIAGRELARLTREWTLSRVWRLVEAIALAAVAGFAFYYIGFHAREPIVRQTMALKVLGAEIEQRGGKEFPLTHVDDPMTLQIYLNTLRPCISYERAAQLLRGAEPAFVAINDWTKLQSARRRDDPPCFTLLPDSTGSSNCPTRIVANRPELKPGDTWAFCFGPVFIQARGARLLRATEKELCFQATGGPWEIRATNELAERRRLRARVTGDGEGIVQDHLLSGNETWVMAKGVPAAGAN